MNIYLCLLEDPGYIILQHILKILGTVQKETLLAVIFFLRTFLSLTNE